MVANIVIGLLVAGYSAFVIYKLVKDKKNGGPCVGCTGSCSGCNKCSTEYIDKLIQKAEKKRKQTS